MSELKTLTYHGKKYFIDTRLQELRNTTNPHDTLSFEEYCELKNVDCYGYPVGLSGCGTCPLKNNCLL